MYRQILRPIKRAPISRVSLITARPYSILDSAKKTLDDINHKIGKAAADTLDAAENVAHDAKSKVEDATRSVTSKAEDVANEIKDKAYEEKEKTTQAAQDKTDPEPPNKLSEKIKDMKHTAENAGVEGQTLEQKARDLKQRFEEAKQKVKDQFD